jgi:hypothetical protein
MNKKQAAETLKSHKTHTNKAVTAAIDKAIEVLSDKTEYVKRATYRKLKAENARLEWLVINKSDELDTVICTHEQLVADASELRMQKEKLESDVNNQANLLLESKINEVKMARKNEYLEKRNEILLCLKRDNCNEINKLKAFLAIKEEEHEQLKTINAANRSESKWLFAIGVCLLIVAAVSIMYNIIH